MSEEIELAEGAGSTLRRPTSSWLLIAGSLLIIGSLLPWAQTGAFSFAGVTGDGVMTLAMGLIIVVLAFPRPSRTTAWFVLGMATVSVLVVASVYNSLGGDHLGPGLYITGAAAVATAAAGIRTWLQAPNPRLKRPKRT